MRLRSMDGAAKYADGDHGERNAAEEGPYRDGQMI